VIKATAAARAANEITGVKPKIKIKVKEELS
jgi:hypothetical protein